MSQREQTNYYEVLEVAPDAPSAEIHKAYQRARQTYSQDNPALYSMFSADEARELLRLIDEAYNVLSNQGSRKTYDDSLGGNGRTSAAPSFSKAPASNISDPQVYSQPANMSTSTFNTPNSEKPMQAPSPTINSFDQNHEGDFQVKKREISKPALPLGTGRTSLSTYKLDDSFEQEIADASEFDGGFLQRVRLYKNISIDKMSDATRISRPYLMAVETNDYKNLPAAVFVRGFIVQVARQLGLEEQKAAASYMKLFKAGGGK